MNGNEGEAKEKVNKQENEDINSEQRKFSYQILPKKIINFGIFIKI